MEYIASRGEGNRFNRKSQRGIEYLKVKKYKVFSAVTGEWDLLHSSAMCYSGGKPIKKLGNLKSEPIMFNIQYSVSLGAFVKSEVVTVFQGDLSSVLGNLHNFPFPC